MRSYSLKGLTTNQTLGAGIGFVVIVIVAAFAMFGGNIPTGGGSGGTAQSIFGPTDDQETVSASSTCNPEATNEPEISFGITNPLNTSATEFKALTVRFYKGDFSSSDLPTDAAYQKDVTSSATGVTGASSTVNLDCDATYTLVVEGTATSQSAIGTVVMDEQSEKITLTSRDLSANITARTYDENARAYVYGNDQTSATTFVTAGATFYNSTHNLTSSPGETGVGLIVGQGGSVDYSLFSKTNTATAIDTQFTDGDLYLIINQDDNGDWPEPTLTLTYGGLGVSAEKVTCGSVASKIANDGYDYCYKVTQNGAAVPIAAGKEIVVRYTNQPKSGVNPADDIVVGFVTTGLFKKTLNDGISSGTNKDDSSETYVHTVNSWTFKIM